MREGKGSWLMNCAGEGRRQMFSGSKQPWSIGFCHATDIPVLEGTTAGPLDHLADSLLLPCRNAPRGRQEFIPEPAELRIAVRSVPIVAGRR